MNQLIYVETSIPSFYFETRPEPENQARRNWTRDWWELAIWQEQLVTSLSVVRELESTPEPKRSSCIDLLSTLPLLATTAQVDQLVRHYIASKVMPDDADGDARHLALATFHKCDILVSWNCRHIANANKARHIEHVNRALGFDTPKLVTPLELIGEEP